MAFSLFALTWLGIQAMGGPSHTEARLPLFVWVVLQGILASPLTGLYSLILLLVSGLVLIAQQLTGILPGIAHTPISQAAPTWVMSVFGPLLAAGVLGILVLGVRRGTQPATGYAKMDRGSDSGASATAQMTDAVGEAGSASGAISTILELEGSTEPTASQMFTRSYLENLEAKALKEKQGTLEEVVYFMSRNFRAYTSIGLLVDEVNNRLLVNAVHTKSRNFNYDCAIIPGEGVVGTAITKPAGFLTGNLKSYPGTLEYYNASENINSIMVMRVMDIQSRRVQGLLVVDSENVRAFSDEHKQLMDRFTRIASAMITNTNMKIAMKKGADQADNQYEIAKSLAAALRMDEVQDIMVDALQRTFEHDRIVICSYDAATGAGYVWKIFGNPGVLTEGQQFDVRNPRSLYGSVFRNRRAVVTQGFRSEERFVRFDAEEPPADRPNDMLLAPIQDDRQSTLAVVGVETSRSGSYSQEELKILKTIMANVSNALSKARMYQEMEQRATIDGLTGIPNHRKFQDFLSVEMERSQRYGMPLTLLLMDIDHFKKFNDTYGHPVGDLVLKTVAKSLTQSVRNTDFVARYGGEEFVVVLIQADEEQSRMLSERIRSAIEATQVPHDNQLLRVTVSIGSATFTQDAANKQELIDNADKAMYQSKNAGRNRVSFFSEFKKPEGQGAVVG
jgi:diguanylate cyclase (GGDEF)-like protein